MQPQLLLVFLAALVAGATSEQQPCAVFTAERSRAQQRQKDLHPQAQEVGFPPDTDDRKHVPYLRKGEGGVWTVTVGEGTVTGDPSLVHPTVPSGDPEVLHFIMLLWVEDEHGEVLAMGKLSPTGSAPSLSFPIPKGTSRARPFSLCNKHGLFQGDEVVVTAAGNQMVDEAPCRLSGCFEPGVGEKGMLMKCMSALSGWTDYPMVVKQDGVNLSVSVVEGEAPYGVLKASGDLTEEAASQFEYVFVEMFEGKLSPPSILAAVAPDPSIPLPDTLASFPLPRFPRGENVTLVASGRHLRWQRVSGSSFDMPPTLYDASLSQGCPVASAGIDPSDPACFLESTFKAELLRLSGVVREMPEGASEDDRKFFEKHVPVAEATAQVVEVTVGAVPHPMKVSTDPDRLHYITAVYAEDQDGRVVAAAELSPSPASPLSVPRFTFTPPKGTKTVTPFAHCNLHGLFKGKPIPVNADPDREAKCGFSEGWCPGRQPGIPPYPEREAAEARRRQGGRPTPPDPTDDGVSKHTPVITLLNATHGKVTVGSQGVLHPTKLGKGSLHFIDLLYVRFLDGAGEIVAMKKLYPDEEDVPPEMTFALPSKAGSLQAFAHCNLHGLFNGDEVVVSPSDQDTLAACGGAPRMVPTLVSQTDAPSDHTPEEEEPSVPTQTRTCRPSTLRGYTCYTSLEPELIGAYLHWTYDKNASECRFALVSEDTAGWLSLTFGEFFNKMAPASGIIVSDNSPDAYVIRGTTEADIELADDEPLGNATFERDAFGTATLGVVHLDLNSLPSPAIINVARDPVKVELAVHQHEHRASFVVDLEGPPRDDRPACLVSTLANPLSKDGDFFQCALPDVMQGTDLHWTTSDDGASVYFAAVSNRGGWVSVGFPEVAGHMAPATAFIALTEADVGKYSITDRSLGGVKRVDGNADEIDAVVQKTEGRTVLAFRAYPGREALRALPINVARHDSSQELTMHTAHAAHVLDLTSGITTVEDPELKKWRRYHAAALGLSWGFFFPMAVLVKRYPRSFFCCGEKGFLGHVFFAFLGTAGTVVGVSISLFKFDPVEVHEGSSRTLKNFHVLAGLPFFGAMFLQPLVGLAAVYGVDKQSRCGRVLRVMHRFFGIVVILFGIFQCATGALRLSEYDERASNTTIALLSTFVVLFVAWIICSERSRRRTPERAEMKDSDLDLDEVRDVRDC